MREKDEFLDTKVQKGQSTWDRLSESEKEEIKKKAEKKRLEKERLENMKKADLMTGKQRTILNSWE